MARICNWRDDREESRELEYKGGFDEVDREVVEDGLCEDQLAGISTLFLNTRRDESTFNIVERDNK